MRTTKLASVALGLALTPVSSFAADLFWGSAGAGGSGPWDNGLTANWFNGAAATLWSAGNTAVFGGTPGVVSVSGIIPGVQGMTFTASEYQVSGGTLSLTSPGISVPTGGVAGMTSALDGTGGMTLTSGTLFLTNTSSILTGQYTIDSGARLIVNANGTFSTNGNDVMVNGILDISGGGSGSGGRYISNLFGSGVITADSLPTAGTANIRLRQGNFAGNIQDGAGNRTNAIVMQAPSGLLRLSGNNTYSGQTLLRGGGHIRLESAGALSPNSWLRFEETSASLYQMAELAYGNLSAINSNVPGGVSFANAHAGFAAIGADRTVTITNPLGEMVFGSSHFNVKSLTFGTTNSTHKVTWTGPFSLGAPSAGTDRNITVLNSPPVVDAEISGAISSGNANGRLYKAGAGTLVLSGANTYQGQTYIAEGTLALANDQAASSGAIRFHLAGSTLRSADMSARNLANELVIALDAVIGTADSGNINVSGPVTTGAGAKTITINNAQTTFSGGLTGDSVSPNVKAGPGTLVIDSSSISTKPLVIREGTLALGPSGSLFTSNILVEATGTFDVSAIPGFGLSAFGQEQVLLGNGTVKGDLTSVSTSAIHPGAGLGTMTFANNLSLNGSRVVFELTNDVAQALNDFLQVNGNLDLAGQSTISLVPLAGNLANGTYKLIKYNGNLTGTLGNLTLAGFGGGATRQIANLDGSTAHEINLVVSGAPASLVWRGDDSTKPNSWDIGTTANWLRGAAKDTFFDYDNVTFNDTAASFNVNLESAVSPSSLTVDTAGTYLFSGPGNLSGVGSLTKSGSGTLILGNFGINNNTGPTTINAGTLLVGNNNDGSGSIGSGDITNNGVVLFRNFNNVDVPGAISGIGSLIAEGQGEVLLHGNSTFTGSVFINTNSLIALRTSAFPAATAASLGATTNVTIKSDGALFLQAGGTYSAPMLLSGDGVGGETSGALHTAATINWAGPLTMEGHTTIGADSGTLTLSGGINGAFNLTKAGAGRVVLSTNNNFIHTTIAGGVLQVGNGGTNGTLGSSPSPISNDGTLEINRSDVFTLNNEIYGTGGVTQSGEGTLVINTANSFSGQFTLTKGVLSLGNDYGVGTGSLRFNNAATIRSSSTAMRTITNSIDFAWSTTFGTADTGDLVFTGPVNTGNAAKDLTINNTTTTFNGVLAGGASSSANRKLGPGTLILNGLNTYIKPTGILAGTLLVNGQIGDATVTVTGGILGGTGTITGPVTVQTAGTLSPGPGVATMTISNVLTLNGTLEIDISANGASDRIQGLTNVVMGGTLKINNLAGQLTTSDTFKIFDATGLSGSFTNVVPTQPGSGLSWDLSTIATDGTLRIATGPVVNPQITTTVVDGSNIKIGWPGAGWVLQSQTNTAGIGLVNTWFDVIGSSTTNEAYIRIDPAHGSVFYRLKSQ